jgi:hyperosmotically inducible protein
MYKVKAVVAGVFCVAIILCFFGCQTTGRTAGQFIDDVGIEAAIRAKFIEDQVVRPFTIHITSYGGEVTLTGAVNSAKAKRRAEKLAYSVKGVRKVNNLIKIR